MEMLNKNRVLVPGGMVREGGRFHHTTQNSLQFKTHESFLSGVFHVMFLDHS